MALEQDILNNLIDGLDNLLLVGSRFVLPETELAPETDYDYFISETDFNSQGMEKILFDRGFVSMIPSSVDVNEQVTTADPFDKENMQHLILPDYYFDSVTLKIIHHSLGVDIVVKEDGAMPLLEMMYAYWKKNPEVYKKNFWKLLNSKGCVRDNFEKLFQLLL